MPGIISRFVTPPESAVLFLVLILLCRRAKVQQKKFIREMERRKQDAKAWAGVPLYLWTCRGTLRSKTPHKYVA